MGRRDGHTDVLYISSVSSPAQFARTKQAVRPGAAENTYGLIEASTKFHTLLQRGLVAQPGVQVTSLVGRSVSASIHRGGWWRAARERLAPNWLVHHFAFWNAPGIKQLGLLVSYFFGALAWRLRTRGNPDRVVLLDGAYLTALPGVLLATAGGRIQRVGIFCDIYSYMAPVADASTDARRGQRLIQQFCRICYRQLDGFVFLTPQMDEVLNQGRRGWLVVEGLVDELAIQPSNQPKAERPTVMYAGALRAQYGTGALVDAMALLDDPDLVLEIYGSGDYLPEVEKAAERDPRIRYGGYLTTDEVERLERRAWLLINPRPAEQEFARYSFPSKLMEYLASGTPVLTTRLPGIPPEYFEVFWPIEEPTAAGIAEAIGAALGQGPEALAARGAAGQQFVREHKGNLQQAARVLRFALGQDDQ